MCAPAEFHTLVFPEQAPNGGAGIPEEFLQLGRRALHVLDLRIRMELLMDLQERIAAGQINVTMDTRKSPYSRDFRQVLPVLRSSRVALSIVQQH